MISRSQLGDYISTIRVIYNDDSVFVDDSICSGLRIEVSSSIAMAIDYPQTKSVQAQSSSESVHIEQVGQEHILSGEFLPVFPVSFLVIWGLAAWFFLDVPKLLRKGASLSRKRCYFPCQSCHYFTDNPYVKCAVHPTIAMTDAAKDCADYSKPSLQ